MSDTQEQAFSSVSPLRYNAEPQEGSAGTPRGVAFRGEISPWMAAAAGQGGDLSPRLLRLRGGIEIAVIEGKNDIEDWIHGHLVFTLVFHYRPAAQGVSAPLAAKHGCE